MYRTDEPIGGVASPDELEKVDRMIAERQQTGVRLARTAPDALRESMDDAPPTLRRADKPATPIPPNAFWNGIARAWFVDVAGEAVRLNPQPPAPGIHGVLPGPRIDL